MQIKISNGEWIAGKLGDENFKTENLYDPKTNIRYGVYYLNYLLNRFNRNEHRALAAYNMGETTVYNKGISRSGYSRAVIRNRDIMRRGSNEPAK